MQVFPISTYRDEEIDTANQSNHRALGEAPPDDQTNQTKQPKMTVRSQNKTARNMYSTLALTPNRFHNSDPPLKVLPRSDSLNRVSFQSPGLPPAALRQNYLSQFRRSVTKLINALGFIRELHQYAEQLRSQHLEFQYHRRTNLPLYPEDLVFIYWHLLMKLVHFVSAIIFPLQLAFDQDAILAFTFALSALMLCDIIFNFLCCHIDENHNLLKHWTAIAQYYITHWFILDGLSILPFEYIHPPLAVLRLVRSVKFFIYQKRVHYKQADDLIHQRDPHRVDSLEYKAEWWYFLRLQKLVTIILDMLLLTHLFACLWLWSTRGYDPNSWLHRYDLTDSPNHSLYIDALSWGFQTITVIGYGVLGAKTSTEFMLQVIWMLVGVGFYSFTIGNLAFILTEHNPNQETDEQLALLEEIGESQHIPQEIMIQLENFVNFNIHRNPYWSEESRRIFSAMPLNLSLYMLAATHREIFANIPFFATNLNFAFSVLPHCVLAKYQPFESIYHVGQSANDFYFLLSGDVRLTDSGGELIIRVMEGTVFGEIESIEQSNRKWHAHSITKSVVMICPGKIFLQSLAEDSPQFFEMKQMYLRRKLFIQDCQKSKKEQLVKVKRSTAIIDGDKIRKPNLKNEKKRCKDDFKRRIDCRTYQSLQQDLMLKVVGERKERKVVLLQKLKRAVDRVRTLIKQSKRRGGTTINPSDFKLIRDLVENRLHSNQYRGDQLLTSPRQIGKRMLDNFKIECARENFVQSFIIKQKYESQAKMRRVKLSSVFEKHNNGEYSKKRRSVKREVEIYYSHFHQQILAEQQRERDLEKARSLNQREYYKVQAQYKQKIREISKTLKLMQTLSTHVSMARFQIIQEESVIDDVISKCQVLVQALI